MAEQLYNICIMNTEEEVDSQIDIVTDDFKNVLDIVDMFMKRNLDVRYRALPVTRYLIENEDSNSNEKMKHIICYEL